MHLIGDGCFPETLIHEVSDDKGGNIFKLLNDGLSCAHFVLQFSILSIIFYLSYFIHVLCNVSIFFHVINRFLIVIVKAIVDTRRFQRNQSSGQGCVNNVTCYHGASGWFYCSSDYTASNCDWVYCLFIVRHSNLWPTST